MNFYNDINKEKHILHSHKYKIVLKKCVLYTVHRATESMCRWLHATIKSFLSIWLYRFEALLCRMSRFRRLYWALSARGHVSMSQWTLYHHYGQQWTLLPSSYQGAMYCDWFSDVHSFLVSVHWPWRWRSTSSHSWRFLSGFSLDLIVIKYACIKTLNGVKIEKWSAFDKMYSFPDCQALVPYPYP